MFTDHLSRPPGKVSLLVIVYNMPRQAENTLFTLSPEYQRNVLAEDYEVVVVENSSLHELREERVKKFGPNFSYHYREESSRSPAAAMNFGFSQLDGPICGLLIDGARMLSPGILQFAFAAFRMNEHALVGVPSYHLGEEVQQISVMTGYDETVEQQMLAAVDWRRDGYRLFDVSKVSNSSGRGVFSYASESNCVFFHRDVWRQIGGADDRFNLAGGGLINLALYESLVSRPDLQLFTLPGEGTFHQFHGGVTTNLAKAEQAPLIAAFRDQYESIHGKKYAQIQRESILLGEIRPPALPGMLHSAQAAISRLAKQKGHP